MTLKHYRKKAGLTQVELAQRAGLSANLIERLEMKGKGKRLGTNIVTIKKLVKALGMTIDELLS